MKRLPTIASAVAATAITVVLVGVAVVGFTPTEKQTITQMKARMARIEQTHAADLAALQLQVDANAANVTGILGDLDTLNANDATLANDVGILDAGLQSIVAEDGPLAQVDRNLAMTQEVVFANHPAIAITGIQPLVACDGTSCTVDVEWTSEPPASGQVEWGTDATYGNLTTKQVEPLAYHKQRLGTFPQDGTTYHFRVLATLGDLAPTASAGMAVVAQ